MRKGVGLALSLWIGFSTAAVAAADRLPAGTPIIVVLNESVSSKTASVGQKLGGSVAQNVTAGAKTVIPRGSPVSLSVASAQPSGRLQNPAKLWLRIDTIQVRGKTYRISSRLAGRSGTSHKKRNVVAIGGGTAAGALIGAIAGGGKGAAIGAAAGAGAGTAGAAATGKKDIVFPAETRLRFTTKSALAIG